MCAQLQRVDSKKAALLTGPASLGVGVWGPMEAAPPAWPLPPDVEAALQAQRAQLRYELVWWLVWCLTRRIWVARCSVFIQHHQAGQRGGEP